MKRLTLLAVALLSIVACNKENSDNELIGTWNVIKTEEYDSRGNLIESTPFCGDYVVITENYYSEYYFGGDDFNGTLLPYVYDKSNNTITILQGASTVDFKSSDKMVIRTSGSDGYIEETHERFKQVEEKDYAKQIIGKWKFTGRYTYFEWGNSMKTYKPEEENESFEMVLSSDGKVTYRNCGEDAGWKDGDEQYYTLFNSKLYVKTTKEEIDNVLKGEDDSGISIRMGHNSLVLNYEGTLPLLGACKSQDAFMRVQ